MTKLSAQQEEKFAKAMRLRDEEDFASARDTLLELVNEAEDNAVVDLMLGHMHEMLNDPDEAAVSYAEAARLRPRWELASIGLFHMLFDLNRKDEAKTEMSRFLKLGKESPLYDALILDQRPQRNKRG